MEIRKLDLNASAAPQIFPEEMEAVRAAGFRTVVNNRPDGEEPGQPAGEEIERAARDAGLAYHFVPVGRDPLTAAQLDEMADALAGNGPALLFCRSGTRSTTLWAFAEARRGRDISELVSLAAQAGYDLAPLEPALRQVAG
ncbi:TIGR01244 family protein [Pacificimonas flava]|uniref:TIGR01244 family protein n=2 Tax=Pacificimonas TaxID=1960290 RepID=A0A219B1W3_9SPHN|nr:MULTISPECIES: TIGR01244 family sulfur transferase [Pacificimonas]MBZ6378003.1 TIGR01244 family phosphatase [Pacificimonas aurantium]OWV32352.1 TIGR01244 family protein [Pacificimonas flava]